MTCICRAKARSLLSLFVDPGITAAILISCTIQSSYANAQVLHVPTPGESRAEMRLNTAKHSGLPELYAFLKPFPKGGDLHMHLSGAVYAETFIAEAVRQGLCVAPVDPGKPAS